LIYLGMGVYFLLKQGRAPYVTRFFIICLLAFIWHFRRGIVKQSRPFTEQL